MPCESSSDLFLSSSSFKDDSEDDDDNADAELVEPSDEKMEEEKEDFGGFD